MKVMLVNGGPHEKGCTNRALEEIAATLAREGIDSEIFWIGNQPVGGCISCRACSKIGKCVFNDVVNEFREKAMDADAFVFGTPVHFSSATGNMTSFMDRFFFSEQQGNDSAAIRYKPAACVVSCRRGGNTATFEQLLKYPTICEMPVISSRYWNMVHGNTPEEVEKDEEGLYTMRVLAHNIAYFLRCREAADAAGIPLPLQEERCTTNFIR